MRHPHHPAEPANVERPRWSEVAATHGTLEQEALYLVRAAAAAGIAVRTVGGVAIYHLLDAAQREAYERVRERPHDIDLLARSKTSETVKELFLSLGYVPDERLIAWHGNVRHRYFHLDAEGRPRVEVDVFLGKPPLCHPIDFIPQLDRPGPAMSPTDLLLQKLQIHDATAKDLVDIAFLLAGFALARQDEGAATIDASRIAGLLARDWGLHHTATTNLARLCDAGAPSEVGSRAGARAGDLLAAIDETPKTRRWKLRAKVGTRAQWYEDVEEVLR